MNFIEQLESIFKENATVEYAIPMEAYMKNIAPFLGIKSQKRKELLNEVWKKNLNEVTSNCRNIAQELFNKKHREFHYCAMEIIQKTIKKNYLIDDIKWIEKLIITTSWWDTIDSIAKNILGAYLQKFPEQIPPIINRFSDSDNMWLNRSAILFQLSYKNKTDYELLFNLSVKHSKSKEFFIQKAIGWALREYGKTNPELVKDFLSNSELKPLSVREAIKNLY